MVYQEDFFEEADEFHPPHPIPYQGSKRQLTRKILSVVKNRKFRRLYEPFAGSAAITIAGANLNLADRYVIGDSLEPLIDIWRAILSSPEELALAYEKLWFEQGGNSIAHYNQVRDKFNAVHDPVMLLYLLARCVKNSPRFNLMGEFNQSADKRRRGMKPDKMRREILGASALLHGRTAAICEDFEVTISDATSADLVYLDPPWQGVTTGKNKRYHQGLNRERLIAALAHLNQRNVPFLLSYDGSREGQTYGELLPMSLNVERLELNVGRSSQATLLGRNETTIESMYVSKGLIQTRAIAKGGV